MKPYSTCPETPQRRSTLRVHCRKTIENYLRTKYPDSAFHSLKFLSDSSGEDDVAAAKSRVLKRNDRKRDLAVAKGSHCSSLAESGSGDSKYLEPQHQTDINEKDADLKTSRVRPRKNSLEVCDFSNPATYSGSSSSVENIPTQVRISEVYVKRGRGRPRKYTQNGIHSSSAKVVDRDVHPSTSKTLLNGMVENSQNVSNNDSLLVKIPCTADSSSVDIVHKDYDNTVSEESLFKSRPVVKVKRLEDEIVECLEQYGSISASRAMFVMGLTPSLAQTPTEHSVRPCDSLEQGSAYSHSKNDNKPFSGFGSLPGKESYVKYVTSHNFLRPNRHASRRKVNQSSKSEFSDVVSGCKVAEDVLIDCDKRLEIRLHDIRLNGLCPKTETVGNEHSKKNTLKSTLRRQPKSLPAFSSESPPISRVIRRSKHSFIKSKTRTVVRKIEKGVEIHDSGDGQNSNAVPVVMQPIVVQQIFMQRIVMQPTIFHNIISAFPNNRWTMEGSRTQYISTSSSSSSDLLIQSLVKQEVDGALIERSLKPEPQGISFISEETKHRSPSCIESKACCCVPGETKIDVSLNGGYLTQKLDNSSEKQRSSSSITITPCGDESLQDYNSSKQLNCSTNGESSFASGEGTLLNRTNPMPPIDLEVQLTQYGCDDVEGSVDPCTTVLTSQEDSFLPKSSTEIIELTKPVEGNSNGIFLSDKDDGISEQLELPSTNPSVTNSSHDAFNQLSSYFSPPNENYFMIQRDLIDQRSRNGEDPVCLHAYSLEMESNKKSVSDTGLCELVNKEMKCEISSDIGGSAITEERSPFGNNLTASEGKEERTPLNIPEALDSKQAPVEEYVEICSSPNLEQNGQTIPDDEVSPIRSPSVASPIENIGVFVEGQGENIYVDEDTCVLAPHHPTNQDNYKLSSGHMTTQTVVVSEALGEPLIHIDATNHENDINPVNSHSLSGRSQVKEVRDRRNSSDGTSAVEEDLETPKEPKKPCAPELPVKESLLEVESTKSCSKLSSVREELTNNDNGFSPVVDHPDDSREHLNPQSPVDCIADNIGTFGEKGDDQPSESSDEELDVNSMEPCCGSVLVHDGESDADPATNQCAENPITRIDSNRSGSADVIISEETPELQSQPNALFVSSKNIQESSCSSSSDHSDSTKDEEADVENQPASLSVYSENVDEHCGAGISQTSSSGSLNSSVIQGDSKGASKPLCDETSRDFRSESPLNIQGCDGSMLHESQAFSAAASVRTEDLDGYQVPLNENNTTETEFWHALEQNQSSSIDRVNVTRLLDEVNHEISFTKSTEPSSTGTSQRAILGETSPINQSQSMEKQHFPVKDCIVSFKQVPESEESVFIEHLSAENSFPLYLCKSTEIPRVVTTSRDSVCPPSCDLPYQWRNDVSDETFHCSLGVGSGSSDARNTKRMSSGFNVQEKNLITENVHEIAPLVAQEESELLIKDHHSSSSIETKVGDILENLTDIDNHLVISDHAEFPNDRNIFDGTDTIFSENTGKFFSVESLVETNDDYHELDKKCSQVTQPTDFLEMSDYTEDLVDACLRENLPESSEDCLPSVDVVETADVSLTFGPIDVSGGTAMDSGQLNKTDGVVVSKEFANECLDIPHLPTEDLGDQNELNSPNASSHSAELIVDGIFCETDEPIYLPTDGALKTVWRQNSSKSEVIQSTSLQDAQRNDISFMNTTNQLAVVDNIKCQPLDANQLDVKPLLEPTKPSSSQGIVVEVSEKSADLQFQKVSFTADEEPNQFENGSIREKKQPVNVGSDIRSKVDDLLFDEEFEQSNNVTPIKRTRDVQIVSPVPSALVGPHSSELLYDEEFELSNNSIPVKKIKVGPSVTITRVRQRMLSELLFDEEFERSNNVTPVKRKMGGKGQLRQPPLQLIDDLLIDENDEPPLNAAQESVDDIDERSRSRNSSEGCLVISSDEESESPQINNYPGLVCSSPAKLVNRPTIHIPRHTKSSSHSLQTSGNAKREFASTSSAIIAIKSKSCNPPLKQIFGITQTPEPISYVDITQTSEPISYVDLSDIDSASESAHSPPRKISKISVNSDEETSLQKQKEFASKILTSERSLEGNNFTLGSFEISSKSQLALIVPPIEQNEVGPINLDIDSEPRNEPHNSPEKSVTVSDEVTQGSKDIIELIDSDTEQAPQSITVDPTGTILYSDSDLSTGYLDDFIDSDDSFSSKKDNSAKPSNSAAHKAPLSMQRQNFIKNYSQQLVKLAETVYRRKRENESQTSLKSQPSQNTTSLTSSRAQSPESLSDRDFMDSEDSSWSDEESSAALPRGQLSTEMFNATKNTTTAVQNSEGPALISKEVVPASHRPPLTSVHSKVDYISSSDEDDITNCFIPPKISSAPLVPRQSTIVTKTTEVSKNKGSPISVPSSSLKGPLSSTYGGIPMDDRGNHGSGLDRMNLISPFDSSTQVIPPLKKFTKGSLNSAVKSSILLKDKPPMSTSSGKASVVLCGDGTESISSTPFIPRPSKQSQNISRKQVSMCRKGKKRSHDTPTVSSLLSTSPASDAGSSRLRDSHPSSSIDDHVSSLTGDDERSSTSDESGAKSDNAEETDFLSSKLVLSRQSLNFIKSVTQKQSKSPNPACGTSKPLEKRIPGKSPLVRSKVYRARGISKPPLANKHS